MQVALRLEDAIDVIVTYLKSPPKPILPNQPVIYDLELNNVITHYFQRERIGLNIENKNRISPIFYDAAWELCRLDILRPGVIPNHYSGVPEWRGEGYSLTAFGHQWLNDYSSQNTLTIAPYRFIEQFGLFQSLFGQTYFRRAQEAVNCYLRGVYLACCIMCGATAESILLAVALVLKDEAMVMKQYLRPSGKRDVENNIVFKNGSKYIREQYDQFSNLISYWRNESAHGGSSDIDNCEAYISLITLLRFAHFMQKHWKTLTSNEREKTLEELSDA